MVAVKRVTRSGREFEVLVDEQDLDLALKSFPAVVSGDSIYVALRVNGKPEYLHRLIMSRVCDHVGVVDHLNGDTLDNRRANLRSCSHRSNIRNNNAAGVYLERGKWVAKVKVRSSARSSADIVGIAEDTLWMLSHGKRARLNKAPNGKFSYALSFNGPRRSTMEEALLDRVRLKHKYHDGELGYGLRSSEAT